MIAKMVLHFLPPEYISLTLFFGNTPATYIMLALFYPCRHAPFINSMRQFLPKKVAINLIFTWSIRKNLTTDFEILVFSPKMTYFPHFRYNDNFPFKCKTVTLTNFLMPVIRYSVRKI